MLSKIERMEQPVIQEEDRSTRKVVSGKIVFKNTIPRIKLNRLLRKQPQELWKPDYWNGQSYEAAIELLPMIQSINVTAINFSNNQFCEHFIHNVSEIGFPKLTILKIANYDITSIEVFQQIRLPSLQRISMVKTKIANFNSLMKANLKKLSCFELDDMATMEIQQLYRSNHLNFLIDYANKRKNKIRRFANKPEYSKISEHQTSDFWLVKFLKVDKKRLRKEKRID